jgi:type III pantothenate kinase
LKTLLLDLGNSRWKLSTTIAGELGAVSVGSYGDPSRLEAALTDVGPGIDRAFVANVAGPVVGPRLVADLERRLGLVAHWVDSTQTMPNVRTGYRKPEQLGVDRLLAMVAARAITNRSLCVVDAGTAVTLDFVSAEGQHLGGFILPGIRLFRDCLLANTAIPGDDVVHGGDVLGRDTPTAIAQGARYSVSGIVESFIAGSCSLFPRRQVDVVIGGGDADEFAPLLPEPCSKLEHLVLRGLAVVASHREA